MPASNSGREYLHDRVALHQHLYDGTIFFGKKACKFRAGDLTLSPPGVITIYDLPRGGTHWCIHFESVALRPGETGFRIPIHLSPASLRGYFEDRFRAITETLRPRDGSRTGSKLATAAAGAQLQHLLLMMAQRPPHEEKSGRKNRRSDHALDAVRLEIELHFQKPLDVAVLAAASGLSRNFFSARFRERFGMTVDGYLLHLRIEMAKNLLISTNCPIKEIAHECGIPDPHYFNKQFRRLTGMSPSLYRSRE
ncbi:MAG: AraC family transcriptional regulator [Verrucomicrobia bacterium]|nr:AraC family transcriptional regulator [Verrucomicrobiota bacterium]